jgi:hypothetical protein
MWLLIPSMGSGSAPARAGSNLDLKSLFPDTGRSVWWNGKSRSPPTLESEYLFWPTAQAHDSTGERGPGFSATDNHYKPHDLPTAANQWRTPDAPGAGGPRNRQGSIGQGHQTTIGEQAEHWQTPATDSFRSRGGDRRDEMGLDQEARNWSTPTTHDEHERYEKHAQGGTPLTAQAHLWASPQARDFRSGETIENYGNPRPLNEQVVNWSTPRAEDSESCGNHPGREGDSLTGQTKLWNTPHGMSNHDFRGKTGGCGGGEFAKQANDWEPTSDSSRPGPPLEGGKSCWCGDPGCALPGHRRKLNPIFVTWLMGWPLWWLLSVPEPLGRLGMASYLSKQRTHLSRLLAAS